MATSMKSSSIRKAQVQVSCFFCKGQGIKWKCDECNVRMCNSCKVTVHQGLPSTQDHDVVSIQDISKSSPDSHEVTSAVISSVFNSYTTTVPAVHALLCSDDDSLYYTYFTLSSKDKFVKGKLLKSSIKILQTYTRKIYDITMNKDSELLFNEHDTNRIQLLSPTGEVTTVLDTSPMRPLAIHVSKDNEVMVGLREQGQTHPVQDFSVRQVIIFSNDYKRKETIECDKKGNKLFSYVARIRTDSRNVVYVIDRINEDNHGRIVAVDRNGRLKFTYDGPKNYEIFKPQGITITPSDNIVVADSGYDSLNVLNSKGELLGLQSMHKDLGIEYPKCVCIDSEGYFLIGCAKGKNEKYGKIHVVKLRDSLI